jgi:hypothetical protein
MRGLRLAGLPPLLSILAALASCGRKPVPPPPPPVPLSVSEVEALLAGLSRGEQSVSRYQGFVRVRGRGPEGGFDAKLVVIFERPSELRVELLGAFGGTRWVAVAGPSGITAYFPGRREYLKEDDTADVVGRLLGLRLASDEVMAVLSGVGLPLEPIPPARGERRGRGSVLDIGDPGKRLEIDEDGQVNLAHGAGYRVSYPTRWRSRGRQVPDRIELSNDTIRATLTAEDVDVNAPVDPGAFVLEVPSGAVRLRPSEVDGEAVFVVEKKPGGERR